MINLDVGYLPIELMLVFSKFAGYCFRRYVGKKVQKLCVTMGSNLVKNRQIRSMVNFAKRHDVEDLDMDLARHCIDPRMPDKLYVVPESIAECKTLRELKLRGCNLKLPSSFGLPFLKKLHLSYVILPTLDTSACPLLEELIIFCCNSTGRHILFTDPFSKDDASGYLNIYAPNQKLHYMKIHELSQVTEYDTELVIHAPHLLSIEIKGCMRKKYNFKNLSSVTTATLDFHRIWRNEWRMGSEALQLMKVLKYLSHVKTFKLCRWCIQVFSFREAQCSLGIPQFSTRSLQLETDLNELELPGLTCLLRNCCNLESLIINIRSEDRRARKWELTDCCFNERESWLVLELVLSSHSHLMTVKITDFLRSKCIPQGKIDLKQILENTQRETELVKVILKRCKMLDKVMIRITDELVYSGDWLQTWFFLRDRHKSELLLHLNKKLLLLPTASVNAKICLS